MFFSFIQILPFASVQTEGSITMRNKYVLFGFSFNTRLYNVTEGDVSHSYIGLKKSNKKAYFCIFC